MGRLSRPLNGAAVKAADDEFYAKHPEFVKDGKRIPLSDTDPSQADLRKEWVDLYKKNGGKEEDDEKKPPAKKPADPVVPCPIQEQNWIELKYLYCDGTGVAGACYRVTNNDDSSVVAQGILDGNGYAWCALPVTVNNVSYDFDKDPPTLEYLKQPIPNPELSKVREGWFNRIAQKIADAGSWTWGAVQGDFNEDQTIGQVATNAVVTMIPVVDQAGDVRDIVANLKFLIWDKRYNDKWVWISLVITLIGLIPVLGSAVKGVLKTIAKALKTSGKVPLKLLIEVLNKFHKGNAIEWLRKLAADLPSHAATVKEMLQDILKSLRNKLQSLRDILPSSLGKRASDTIDSVDEVAKIADGKVDEAVKELQEGLNKSLDEGVEFEKKGVTKSENTRQQTDANPPELLIGPSKTTPTGKKSGNPEGKKSPETGSQAHKHKRENEAAAVLAEHGYKVKQNLGTLPNGKNPDYEIEGKIFDCLTPDSSNIEQVRKGISRKVDSGQADRIVLNLDDSPFTPEDISKILSRKPKEGLNEVIGIKDGKIVQIFP